MNRKYLSLKEIQQKELELLIKATKYFEKNNIRYFLDGGTLLGAVRHKGFIPWDDDIDVGIPRPDFDKFIDLVKRDKSSDLLVTYSGLKNSVFAFAKIIDQDVVLENTNDVESNNLWIDIFPMDGVTGSEKKINKKIKKIKFIEKMIRIKSTKITLNNIVRPKYLAKFFLKPISLLFSPKLIIGLATKNDFDNCSLAGNIIWGRGYQSVINRAYLEEYIDIEFEGMMFKTLKNYDAYLKKLYGDYMKLPPEDQRETHGFKAYINKGVKKI